MENGVRALDTLAADFWAWRAQRQPISSDDIPRLDRAAAWVSDWSPATVPRQMPEAPAGVPDSFEEHVKLMFDLQALAFASDVTRIFSFKMARDASSRAYPDSGVTTGFHPASHHQDREARILEYAKINKYHVGMLPYFLTRLKNTPDGDSNLLERSLIIYGSPMGNSNVHNHKRCPLFFAGHAGGKLKGNLHLKAADGTPMANVLLTVLHTLGLDDMAQFGDSTGTFDLTSVGSPTTVAPKG